ncbi:MAG: hypothetical protein HQK85_03165 [Nitrospinae bacterium]|nr:hypothetical protein [Nitrospinota bacterium]
MEGTAVATTVDILQTAVPTINGLLTACSITWAVSSYLDNRHRDSFGKQMRRAKEIKLNTNDGNRGHEGPRESIDEIRNRKRQKLTWQSGFLVILLVIFISFHAAIMLKPLLGESIWVVKIGVYFLSLVASFGLIGVIIWIGFVSYFMKKEILEIREKISNITREINAANLSRGIPVLDHDDCDED